MVKVGVLKCRGAFGEPWVDCGVLVVLSLSSVVGVVLVVAVWLGAPCRDVCGRKNSANLLYMQVKVIKCQTAQAQLEPRYRSISLPIYKAAQLISWLRILPPTR